MTTTRQDADLIRELRLQYPDTPHHRDELHRRAADRLEELTQPAPAKDPAAALALLDRWATEPRDDDMMPQNATRVEVSSEPVGFGKIVGTYGKVEQWPTLSTPTQRDSRDAARYRALRDALYSGSVDVGEAYITMRVVGSCPTEIEFDIALDRLVQPPNKGTSE